MAIHIGQSAKDQAAINIGSQGIQKVYVGEKLVWPSSLDANSIYGVYYNLPAILDSRNICPVGWRVPTVADWYVLVTLGGGDSVIGGKLKESGITRWNDPNTGATNDYSFDFVGSGQRRDDGVFQNFKNFGAIRLNREDGIYVGFYNNTVESNYASSPYYGVPVRLLKEDSVNDGTMIGTDGRIYETVLIGTQVWMKENYKTEYFRNGDNIPYVESDAAWAALTTPGYCYPNGNILNV